MTISVCKRCTQPCLTLILSTYLKLKTQQLTQHGFFQDPLITLCEDFVYDLSSYMKNQKSIFLCNTSKLSAEALLAFQNLTDLKNSWFSRLTCVEECVTNSLIVRFFGFTCVLFRWINVWLDKLFR